MALDLPERQSNRSRLPSETHHFAPVIPDPVGYEILRRAIDSINSYWLVCFGVALYDPSSRLFRLANPIQILLRPSFPLFLFGI
jgi:hypothetical protein